MVSPLWIHLKHQETWVHSEITFFTWTYFSTRTEMKNQKISSSSFSLIIPLLLQLQLTNQKVELYHHLLLRNEWRDKTQANSVNMAFNIVCLSFMWLFILCPSEADHKKTGFGHRHIFSFLSFQKEKKKKSDYRDNSEATKSWLNIVGERCSPSFVCGRFITTVMCCLFKLCLLCQYDTLLPVFSNCNHITGCFPGL